MFWQGKGQILAVSWRGSSSSFSGWVQMEHKAVQSAEKADSHSLSSQPKLTPSICLTDINLRASVVVFVCIYCIVWVHLMRVQQRCFSPPRIWPVCWNAVGLWDRTHSVLSLELFQGRLLSRQQGLNVERMEFPAHTHIHTHTHTPSLPTPTPSGQPGKGKASLFILHISCKNRKNENL